MINTEFQKKLSNFQRKYLFIYLGPKTETRLKELQVNDYFLGLLYKIVTADPFAKFTSQKERKSIISSIFDEVYTKHKEQLLDPIKWDISYLTDLINSSSYFQNSEAEINNLITRDEFEECSPLNYLACDFYMWFQALNSPEKNLTILQTYSSFWVL